MPDLSSRYLGLALRTPLVASSSPLTGTLDGLRRLEDAGVAACVLPSLFEEEVVHFAVEVDRMFAAGSESFAEALSYHPEQPDYDTGPERHLELLRRAKESLAVPVIASLNGTSQGGWLEYAKLLADGGADALELNVYRVAADPDETAERVESETLALVREVRAAVRIPLAVKLGPHFTALAHFARALEAEGADGLVLFNRFYQPDLDLERLEVVPRLVLSHSDELRLPLRWIAILRGTLRASLAATSGIHGAEDALKALLAGADAAMMTSALLQHGPSHLSRVESALLRWLEEREYASVEQLKGSMSRSAVPDPEAFERANYLRTLRSWSGRIPS